jgi:TetR/AcrR family transcriptional regulator, cholesterol catabolism regulator
MSKIKSNKNGTRKDVIISKAARLFREKGYSASSMRDLAEEVGVEAASLYNHISSKSEILQEICFKVANKFMSHIETIDSSELDSIAKIEAVLRFHVQQMIHHYEEVYVSDREWKHLIDPYLSNYQNQRRTYRQRMAHIIENGIRKGEVKTIDAPTAVLIMLHAVSGIESWHRSKKKISGEQLEDNMLMILVDGLRNR